MSSSPLQGDIADKVEAGLTDFLYEVTFVEVDESYDASAGETTITRTEHTCRGFRDEFGKGVISDGLAKQTDAKFVLLQNTLTDSSDNQIEPDGNDEIKNDGTTYSVINGDNDYGVQQDPAGAIWTVQARA